MRKKTREEEKVLKKISYSVGLLFSIIYCMTNFTSCKYEATLQKEGSDGILNYRLSGLHYGVTGVIASDATEIVIPKAFNGFSVTTIEESAFKNCSFLEKVFLPDSITLIGNNAFENCCLLKSITIGKELTWIGASAFESCYELESIDIPEKVTFIGGFAFYGCSSLKYAYFCNSEGWTSLRIESQDNIIENVIASEDLTNPETAAKLLRSAYNSETEGQYPFFSLVTYGHNWMRN